MTSEPATVDTPLKKLVGERTAKALASHLDLHTAGDLIYHFPRRYDERGEHTDIRSLDVGEQVTVLAQVQRTAVRPMRQRRGNLLEVTVGDGSGGVLTLTFFGNQAWRERELRPGRWGLFAGKVTEFRGKRQLNGPEYVLLGERGDGEAAANEEIEEFAGALIPVYPAAAAVPTWVIARCVRVVLDTFTPPDDPLPATVRASRNLVGIGAALREIHRPSSKEELYRARRRLKWDEAFAVQLTLVQRKHRAAAWPAKARPAKPGGLLDAFDARLPYELTSGQQVVGREIAADLATAHPMHRLLQGEVGSGKAQPLDAQVLTPTGFRLMGELAVGDEVIAADGETTTIVGVYPQGERDVYRLNLSDGSSVECDLDHLWAVNTTVRRDRGNPLKALTTGEIAADLKVASGSSKWYLPMIAPPELDCFLDRPLDPYLLGVLIGDGCLRNGRVMVTTSDAEIVCETIARLPGGCHLAKPDYSRKYDWFIVGCRRGKNPVIELLTSLGLMGHGAHDKFIPRAYLVAPVAVRHLLLQGLLDTDGTIDRRSGSNVSFLTASERLASGVRWLVQSLGGTCRIHSVTKVGRQYFQASIRLPNEFPPFRLQRKAALVRTRTKYAEPVRAIRSVEYAGRKQMQCISIAHSSQLYVTDGFVVTHNTVVALRAMLQVVDAGGQAALLAPTEVLAAQHHRGMLDLLGPLAQAGELGAADDATRVELITGSLGAAARRRALTEVAEGRAGIVLGTHALLYEGVDFHDLGLVVVDEQHRFGVEQRDALRAKADQPPHVLVMTATPIPRTVAMTVYGDLEISTLSQLPQGRSPIASHVVPAAEKPAFLDRAWRRLREEVAKGHQAYVVCPRIGEGPASDEEAPREDDSGRRPPLAVTEVAPLLAEGPLHGLRIGVLHGRLPADEKDAVMRSYAAGDLDVLVATTVVEVGVNVPNATVMIVLDADRFGVSQLHQLRGRVGRGSAAGLCLLVTEAMEGSPARERLDAVASTTDGFKLAELDLEQRREGDVLGATQSGRRSHLRLLSLLRDTDLIRDARAEAITLVEEDPELAGHPALAASVAALVDEERAEYLEKG